MVSKKHHVIDAMIVCAMICISGCANQDAPFVPSGDPVKVYARRITATDEFLYAASGSLYCFDWEGNLIWESQNNGSGSMVFAGDAFLVKTYDKSERTGGVALLDREGHMLWQRETGLTDDSAIGMSDKLLVAGSREGILYALSKTGEVLWTYSDSYAVINQVAVAPDSSCVVFTDYDRYIKCVSDGKLIWKKPLEKLPYVGLRRTVAFAPDSSYLVYGSALNEPHIVGSTLDGEELWTYPLQDHLQSVAVTHDSQYIIAASSRRIYKFSSDGTLVWETKIGKDNQCIAITPEADYIVLGSHGSFSSTFVVLNGEGEVLWKTRSFDNIFTVAVSPDGKYVAFSSRQGKIFIFLNLEESSDSES